MHHQLISRRNRIIVKQDMRIVNNLLFAWKFGIRAAKSTSIASSIEFITQPDFSSFSPDFSREFLEKNPV